MSAPVKVAILGGSGYAGGEVLRLLLAHPHVEVTQVTSEREAGHFVHGVHPNLRGRTQLKFVPASALEPADVLVAGLPHGELQRRIEELAPRYERIIDLSADFRLRDLARYERWYGEAHAAPAWVSKFVYGLPETRREALRGARWISGVGCNATAANLALLPLVRSGLLDLSRPIVVDIKVGSSEGGNAFSLASHHPERSGAVRSFAPAGHRHAAEVEQELGLEAVHFSVTAIEMVRGVLATAHAWLKGPVEEKELWRAWRAAYAGEPFVRIVRDKRGVFRYPEPKILAGSNWADVGFEVDPASGRVVALCAIDNLMKGAAGSAVQCLNLACGWDETVGLEFTGLHP